LLKVNFVRSGTSASTQASADEIAVESLLVLKHTVPCAILSLSGGMSEEDATEASRKINQLEDKHPWRLSFSFGRALQHTSMKLWGGNNANID
jgi:fructose-bisphosphate aldolase, class I